MALHLGATFAFYAPHGFTSRAYDEAIVTSRIQNVRGSIASVVVTRWRRSAVVIRVSSRRLTSTIVVVRRRWSARRRAWRIISPITIVVVPWRRSTRVSIVVISASRVVVVSRRASTPGIVISRRRRTPPIVSTIIPRRRRAPPIVSSVIPRRRRTPSILSSIPTAVWRRRRSPDVPRRSPPISTARPVVPPAPLISPRSTSTASRSTTASTATASTAAVARSSLRRPRLSLPLIAAVLPLAHRPRVVLRTRRHLIYRRHDDSGASMSPRARDAGEESRRRSDPPVGGRSRKDPRRALRGVTRARADSPRVVPRAMCVRLRATAVRRGCAVKCGRGESGVAALGWRRRDGSRTGRASRARRALVMGALER